MEERLVDYDKLKDIFSDNREVMEQVMMGLMLAVHDKSPALKRYYNNEDWEKLIETADFLDSAYKHVSRKELLKLISGIKKLAHERKKTSELNNAIASLTQISSYVVSDIEHYLKNL